jgi:hypothetical protein
MAFMSAGGDVVVLVVGAVVLVVGAVVVVLSVVELAVVVVVVVGTVVVLAGAVVAVVLVVAVVPGLVVLLVLSAPAVAGTQMMAATRAQTATRTGPTFIDGVPRRAGVLACSCRRPPPTMAIDWRIRGGARGACPTFAQSGSARQVERIPPDRLERRPALGTAGPSGRTSATGRGPALTGLVVTLLPMFGPTETLRRPWSWRPAANGISIGPDVRLLGMRLGLFVQGRNGRRGHPAP